MTLLLSFSKDNKLPIAVTNMNEKKFAKIVHESSKCSIIKMVQNRF